MGKDVIQFENVELTINGREYALSDGVFRIETKRDADGEHLSAVQIQGNTEGDTRPLLYDIPPWKPIADWLARLPSVSCDEEHEDTRAPQNMMQKTIRKRYEKTAKAIAYDIATNGVADE